MNIECEDFAEPYLEMGIINPLSVLPYFRIYSFRYNKIVDIPCSAWYMRNRIFVIDDDVMCYCFGERFPCYINGAWNREGYYIIKVTSKYAKLVDMYGNKRVITSKKELVQLIRCGQILNVTIERHAYPVNSESSFKNGSLYCYYYVDSYHMSKAKICKMSEIENLDNLISLRAKMLGVTISDLRWMTYGLFGFRLAGSMDIANSDTFAVPQGITQIALNRMRPCPRNFISTEPAFRFADFDPGLNFDSVILTDALSCTIQADMSCNLLKARTVHAKVIMKHLKCDTLMLWGVYMHSNQTYNAHLYIDGNNVKEMILYHVVIHSEMTMKLQPGTKVILCDCQFADKDAEKVLANCATVISEPEMLALWDFQPSVLANRLCVPGI